MQGDATQGEGATVTDEAAVKDRFRAAMRRLAGTVTIVTVRSGEICHGTTATAVTSVSMDPPSMLVCINRDSRLHAYLLKEATFCVNVLHADNVDASRIFASPVSADERFAGGDWQLMDQGAPWLADAQASIFCIKDRVIEYGSHTIFIGRVTDVKIREDISPLIYRDGSYGVCAGFAEKIVAPPPSTAKKRKS